MVVPVVPPEAVPAELCETLPPPFTAVAVALAGPGVGVGGEVGREEALESSASEGVEREVTVEEALPLLSLVVEGVEVGEEVEEASGEREGVFTGEREGQAVKVGVAVLALKDRVGVGVRVGKGVPVGNPVALGEAVAPGEALPAPPP